jgi:hypothetical protein
MDFLQSLTFEDSLREELAENVSTRGVAIEFGELEASTCAVGEGDDWERNEESAHQLELRKAS